MSAAEDSAPDSLLFDTAGMDPEAAFERYRNLYGVGAEAMRVGPDFRARVEAWRLDRMLLYDRRLNDVGHRRDAQWTRSDGFDHFTATLVLGGVLEVDGEDGTRSRPQPGEVLLVNTLPGDPPRPRRLSPRQRRRAQRDGDRPRRQGGRRGQSAIRVDMSTGRPVVAPQEEVLMSRKPSFANLRTAPKPAEPAPTPEPTIKPGRPPSRAGRKQIAGFFPAEMSLALHMLALRQDRSLQALMAEAFDDVLRKHGESPVGD